jgi:hypothetical protein
MGRLVGSGVVGARTTFRDAHNDDSQNKTLKPSLKNDRFSEGRIQARLLEADHPDQIIGQGGQDASWATENHNTLQSISGRC